MTTDSAVPPKTAVLQHFVQEAFSKEPTAVVSPAVAEAAPVVKSLTSVINAGPAPAPAAAPAPQEASIAEFGINSENGAQSTTEVLKGFMSWLRTNNLLKTEKALLDELNVEGSPEVSAALSTQLQQMLVELSEEETEEKKEEEEPVVEEPVAEEEVVEPDTWEHPDEPGFIRVQARPGDEYYELWSDEEARSHLANYGVNPPFEPVTSPTNHMQHPVVNETLCQQHQSLQQHHQQYSQIYGEGATAQISAAQSAQKYGSQGAGYAQQYGTQQQAIYQQPHHPAYYAAAGHAGQTPFTPTNPAQTLGVILSAQAPVGAAAVSQQPIHAPLPNMVAVAASLSNGSLQAVPRAMTPTGDGVEVRPAGLPNTPGGDSLASGDSKSTTDDDQDTAALQTAQQDEQVDQKDSEAVGSRRVGELIADSLGSGEADVDVDEEEQLRLAYVQQQQQALALAQAQALAYQQQVALQQQQALLQVQQAYAAQVSAHHQHDMHAQPAVVYEHYQNQNHVAQQYAAVQAQLQVQQPAQQQLVTTANPYAAVAPPPRKEPIYEAFSLKVIYEVGRTGFEEHKDFPIQTNTIIAGRYQILEYLGSAAFSRAVQCLDLKTQQLVCVKIIRNSKDFFDQSLDEIKLLQYINSRGDPDEKCVLQLYDYFYHKEHLFLVCELLRDNLYEFSKYNRDTGDEPYFNIPRLQRISRQVLTALQFVHSLNLIHCDLKPENILIKSYSRCEVKVIDFGSSCFTSDHLSSYVQSRCYRAPEVVLGLPYDQKIDMWSLGCILAELFTGRVLFYNDSLPTMMARIVAIMGDIPDNMLARAKYTNRFYTKRGILYERMKDGQMFYLHPKRTKLRHRLMTNDSLFLDFVNQLLQLDPARRPNAGEALQHPFLAFDYGPINCA